MSYEQFLEVIDEQRQGALRVSIGLATTFADVYRFLQFAQTFIDRRAPSSDASDETLEMDKSRSGDTTILLSPAEKKRFLVRVCVCGYQDNRLDKRFCPHCGRPMPTTQSTLSEVPPEFSQAGSDQG